MCLKIEMLEIFHKEGFSRNDKLTIWVVSGSKAITLSQ